MGRTTSSVVRGGEVDSSTTRLPRRRCGHDRFGGGDDEVQVGLLVLVEGGGHGDDEGIRRSGLVLDGQVAGFERRLDQGAQARLVDVQLAVAAASAITCGLTSTPMTCRPWVAKVLAVGRPM